MSFGKLKLGRAIVTAVALSGGMLLCVGTSATASAAPHPAGSPSPVRTPPKVTWRFGASGCSGGFCGQYLQISHSGKRNGTWVEIRNGPGDSNEQWYSMFFNNNGEYAFINVHSHKCLNDRNNHLTGHVDQWGCGSYPSDNRWFENPGQPHTWSLESVSNGLSACVLSNDRWVTFGAAGSGSCFWH
jgi:Ricin-type beta-trefoil lectin domain-like